MGQSSSKPLSSRVFVAPEVKVDPSLRAELESSPETDVVRRLYSEKYIEDQVAKRLYDEKVAVEADLAANSKSIAELSDDRLVGVPESRELRKKVSELHKELTGRPLRGELDKQGKAAREKLVNCLVSNKDQPLKCRQVFAEFQQEVSRVEKEIASQ